MPGTVQDKQSYLTETFVYKDRAEVEILAR
jgi:hypothetical protein